MSNSDEGLDPSGVWSRWDEVDPLLEEALDLPPADRQAFLNQACSDAELRTLLGELLELSDSDTLTGPGEHILRAAFADGAPQDPMLGQRIGLYRVTGHLGAGGMGTVYRGERADGAFERDVAIKILRGGLLLHAPELGERFRQERQILASLNHPGIAQLIDGGLLDDGRPFLVMEFVEGERVDDYATRRALGVEARIKLALDIAEVVEYAHRHMIVHRDLKPGNILITSEGRVKLLDFGIAKLLEPPTGVESGLSPPTRLDARFVTPEWSAPEQVLGERVSTQTDVYSLAAILYYLLTGRKPFEGRDQDSVLQRVVRGEEPTAPSAAVIAAPRPSVPTGTKLEGGAPEAKASHDLSRRLSGDLDAILLRGLQSRPEERYGSVAAFREDLERHLSGAAVVARGDALLYRARKFARRNRAPLAAAAAIFLLVSGSAVGLAVQSGRVKAERDRATREAETARQVTGFLVDLFQGSDPRQQGSDTVSVRALLERGAARADEELAEQPAVRAAMLEALGRVYASLGEHLDGDVLLERAVRLRRDSIPNQEGLAEALLLRGLGAADAQDFDLAADSYAQAIEVLWGSGQDSLLAGAQISLGNALVRLELLDSAEASLRRGIEGLDRISGDRGRRLDAATALAGLARRRGDLDEAAHQYAEIVAGRREVGPEGREELAISLNNLAVTRRMQGAYDEAAAHYREAHEIMADLLGPGHPTSLLISGNLATALASGGRAEEAIRVQQERVDAAQSRWPDGHWRVAAALMNLGGQLLQEGSPEAAVEPLTDALDMMMLEIGPMHSWTNVYRGWLGTAGAAIGRNEGSARLFDQSLEGLGTYEGLSQDGSVKEMLRALLRVMDQYGLSEQGARYRALTELEEGG